MKVILDQQQDVVCSQSDTEGATPLHYTMLTGCVEIANLLLTKVRTYNTGIHVCTCSTCSRIHVHDFIVQGADPTAPDDQGLTPLHWASALGKTPLVKCLLQHCNVSDTETRGSSVLVSTLSSGGQSALHIAASVGSHDVCEALISAHAEVQLVLHVHVCICT